MTAVATGGKWGGGEVDVRRAIRNAIAIRVKAIKLVTIGVVCEERVAWNLTTYRWKLTDARVTWV